MSFVSYDELQAALPYVLDAPKDASPIEQLCLRPDYGERTFVDKIQLTREHGIPGERWEKAAWLKLKDGRPDPRIQVCILGKRVQDLVYTDPDNMVHPGDTFTTDMDFTEENMPEGTLLSVGSAVLRVSSKFNTACVKWKERYGADALRWVVAAPNRPYRLRGVLCEIHQDGWISTGDVLRKV